MGKYWKRFGKNLRGFLFSTENGPTFQHWMSRHCFTILGSCLVVWVLFFVPQVSHLFSLPWLFPFSPRMLLFSLYVFLLAWVYLWLAYRVVPSNAPVPAKPKAVELGLIPRIKFALRAAWRDLVDFFQNLGLGFRTREGCCGWIAILLGSVLWGITILGVGETWQYFLSPPIRYTASVFLTLGGILWIYKGNIFCYEGCQVCEVGEDCEDRSLCEERKKYIWTMLRNALGMLILLNIIGETFWLCANTIVWFSFRVYALWAIVHILFCILLLARMVDTWDYYSPAPVRLFSLFVLLGWLTTLGPTPVGKPITPEQFANQEQKPALTEEEISKQWFEQLEARIDQIPEEEPVILVAASGGGSRAAVFTSLVLEGLSRELTIRIPKRINNNETGQCVITTKIVHPEKNVIMISSVSGGTLASAYYLSQASLPQSERQPASEVYRLQHSSRSELLRQIQQELEHDNGKYYTPGVKDLFQSNGKYLSQKKLEEVLGTHSDSPLQVFNSRYVDEMCLNFMAPLLRGAIHPGWERGRAVEEFWRERFKLAQTNFPSLTAESPNENGSVLPLLCCNASAIEQGNQIVIGFPPVPQSLLACSSSSEKDSKQATKKPREYPRSLQNLETHKTLRHQFSLSEAVRVSANFPYGFSVAQLELEKPEDKYMLEEGAKTLYLTDGGMFDNTGVTTLRYLLEGLACMSKNKNHPYHENALSIVEKLSQRGILILEIDSGAIPQRPGALGRHFGTVFQPMQAATSAMYANARLSVENHVIGIQSQYHYSADELNQSLQDFEETLLGLQEDHVVESEMSSALKSILEAKEALRDGEKISNVRSIRIQCNGEVSIITAWALGSEQKARIFLRYLDEKNDFRTALGDGYSTMMEKQDLLITAKRRLAELKEATELDVAPTVFAKLALETSQEMKSIQHQAEALRDRSIAMDQKIRQNVEDRVLVARGLKPASEVQHVWSPLEELDEVPPQQEANQANRNTSRSSELHLLIDALEQYQRGPVTMARLYALPEMADPEEIQALQKQIDKVLESLESNSYLSPENKTLLQTFQAEYAIWKRASEPKPPSDPLRNLAKNVALAYRKTWKQDPLQGKIQNTPVFQQQRQAMYASMLKVTESMLNTNPVANGALTPKLRSEFWEHYWGKLLIVEEEDVEDAMVDLGKALQAAKKANAPSKDVASRLVELQKLLKGKLDRKKSQIE